MMNTRNSLANSVNIKPRVSISSTNVLNATRRKSSSSAQSRHDTTGNVYYSSVPVEDSVTQANNKGIVLAVLNRERVRKSLRIATRREWRVLYR